MYGHFTLYDIARYLDHGYGRAYYDYDPDAAPIRLGDD